MALSLARPQSTAPIDSRVASPPVQRVRRAIPGIASLSLGLKTCAKLEVNVVLQASGTSNMIRRSSNVPSISPHAAATSASLPRGSAQGNLLPPARSRSRTASSGEMEGWAEAQNWADPLSSWATRRPILLPPYRSSSRRAGPWP